jgi:septal ring factor EnvC (AmiA/AmiB activator)
MMTSRRRTDRLALPRALRGRRRVVALLAALSLLALGGALAPLSSSAQQSLNQLNSSLSHEQARAGSLSASVGDLSHLISSLDAQISLVQSREAAVRSELATDRARLLRVSDSLARERRLVALLISRLARARKTLSSQLVSAYEGDKPDIVTVILESHGFSELLDQLSYLHQAEHQQQSLIAETRAAKAAADAATKRLAKLEVTDRAATTAEALHARALAGMNALLASREGALQHARAAQQTALAAARAKGSQLQKAISKVKAQQAAAQQAAFAGPGAALGPSGGWAIPYAIVLCESGGQNLPPNSAGASGYYQIIPSTWAGFGGTGPAAYLASKAEQDAVASRIWNGGAGASNWVCAGIVGIH